MTTKETGPKNVLKKQQGFYLMQWQAGRREMLEGPHDRASVIEVAICDLGFPITKANFETHAKAAGVRLGPARYGDTQLNVRVRILEWNQQSQQAALVMLAKLVELEVDQLHIQEHLEQVELSGSSWGTVRDVPGQIMLVPSAEEAVPDGSAADSSKMTEVAPGV